MAPGLPAVTRTTVRFHLPLCPAAQFAHMIAPLALAVIEVWDIRNVEPTGANEELLREPAVSSTVATSPSSLHHSDWVTSVAWHPIGRQIVSASKDGTCRIWVVG